MADKIKTNRSADPSSSRNLECVANNPKWVRIVYTTNSATTVEKTNFEFAAGTIIQDVVVECLSTGSGGTVRHNNNVGIDVGLWPGETGGDADGFIVGATVAYPHGPGSSNKTTFLNVNGHRASNNAYGALLTTSTDNSLGDGRKYHVCDGTAKTVAITGSTNAKWAVYFNYTILGEPQA
jgi:hypothetical protein